MTFGSNAIFFPRKMKEKISQQNFDYYVQSWMGLNVEYTEIAMCTEAML